MKSSRKLFFGAVAVLLASTPLFGQVKVPVKNWTVPPFDASMFNQSGIGIRPLTHSQGNNPAVFVPFGPCRLTDSRVSSGGPGPIAGGGTRDYDFVPSGCPFITNLQAAQDVSSPIIAWSLNFTVLNTAGPGFLYAYPTGGTPPPVSILNYTGAAGEIRNNAAIVPVNAATGSFTVGTGVSATDVIIDANGVFLATLEPGTTFQIISTTLADAIRGTNTYPSIGGGVGVRGESINYNGVWAQSTNLDALAAFGGRDGGYLQGARHGVIGATTATTTGVYGVVGSSASTANDAAGVIGSNGSAAVPGRTGWVSVGVRGESSVSAGVLGLSGAVGVAGVVTNTVVPGYVAQGQLGRILGPYGVFAFGDYGGTGAKYFVEPHPTDASKVIRYIALEGSEAGTYFRGRARFERGMARIAVPEDFRMVTDEEGLTVQVTPIGPMATFSVLKADLNEIVVQSSRNVEFYYLVNGVRRTHRHLRDPIVEGQEYVPQSADAKMPGWLTAGQKLLLIQNGTYRSDGSVNMETAQRLGWDKVWEKRNPPAPAPNPE